MLYGNTTEPGRTAPQRSTPSCASASFAISDLEVAQSPRGASASTFRATRLRQRGDERRQVVETQEFALEPERSRRPRPELTSASRLASTGHARVACVNVHVLQHHVQTRRPLPVACKRDAFEARVGVARPVRIVTVRKLTSTLPPTSSLARHSSLETDVPRPLRGASPVGGQELCGQREIHFVDVAREPPVAVNPAPGKSSSAMTACTVTSYRSRIRAALGAACNLQQVADATHASGHTLERPRDAARGSRYSTRLVAHEQSMSGRSGNVLDRAGRAHRRAPSGSLRSRSHEVRSVPSNVSLRRRFRGP